MIKLFRRIRQNLLSENKFSKYAMYAIGEILLVVIGIFIALQLNNWNNNRVEQLTVTSYYERIHEELQIIRDRFDGDIKGFGQLVDGNRQTLRILKSDNRDSIPALAKTLGALGTVWTTRISTPVTDEFLSQGYLHKIENDSIKHGLRIFTLVKESISTGNEYTRNQYTNTIEPFFNKHINYSEVAMERYRPDLEMGGPPNDYEALFNSLELWNITTFKLENLSGLILSLEWSKESVEWLDEQIVAELAHRNKD